MNLALQTLFSYLQLHSTLVVVVVAGLLLLYAALFLFKLNLNKRAVRSGVLVGLVSWLVLMASLPALTGSSLGELKYSADYIGLALMSLGFAVLITLFALPLARLSQSSKS